MIIFYFTKKMVEREFSSDGARQCQVVKYWIFFKTLQRLSHPHGLRNYRHVLQWLFSRAQTSSSLKLVWQVFVGWGKQLLYSRFPHVELWFSFARKYKLERDFCYLAFRWWELKTSQCFLYDTRPCANWSEKHLQGWKFYWLSNIFLDCGCV